MKGTTRNCIKLLFYLQILTILHFQQKASKICVYAELKFCIHRISCAVVITTTLLLHNCLFINHLQLSLLTFFTNSEPCQKEVLFMVGNRTVTGTYFIYAKWIKNKWFIKNQKEFRGHRLIKKSLMIKKGKIVIYKSTVS